MKIRQFTRKRRSNGRKLNEHITIGLQKREVQR
jgi:hypothetical protein